jgi:hypothetical protein
MLRCVVEGQLTNRACNFGLRAEKYSGVGVNASGLGLLARSTV